RQLFSELQDVDLLLKPLTTNAVPNGSRDSYGSLVDQQSALLAQIKKAEGEGRISVIQAMAFRQQVQTLSLQSVRYQAAADSWRLSGLSQKLKNVSEGLNRSIVSIPGFDY
ncbi:MAG: hypothetical protein K8F91_06575, partial [Candidatus Obscuribacterales bacterium]|nr:hypothetical protein [Candidatus Obscuribacterales bacterium]